MKYHIRFAFDITKIIKPVPKYNKWKKTGALNHSISKVVSDQDHQGFLRVVGAGFANTGYIN
jgi:hypothetical protein